MLDRDLKKALEKQRAEYGKRLEELNSVIQERNDLAQKIAAINQLLAGEISPSSSSPEVEAPASIPEKVRVILTQAGRAMHGNEIVKALGNGVNKTSVINTLYREVAKKKLKQTGRGVFSL